MTTINSFGSNLTQSKTSQSYSTLDSGQVSKELPLVLTDNFDSQKKITTENLIDSSMCIARGKLSDSWGSVHQRLLKAVRQFAMITEPVLDQKLVLNECDIQVETEGFRVTVSLKKNNNSIVLSGPPKQAVAWIVDSIYATEKEAMDMLEKTWVLWPIESDE